MSKINEARQILEDVGMPKAQQSELCGYTLLALASVASDMVWVDAVNKWMRIHDIIQFIDKNYHIIYAENSRETIRKQALHHFVRAALVEDDNRKATNSPNYRYRLTSEFLALIQCYGNSKWASSLYGFKNKHESLIQLYASKKQVNKTLITVNKEQYMFSAGAHTTICRKLY